MKSKTQLLKEYCDENNISKEEFMETKLIRKEYKGEFVVINKEDDAQFTQDYLAQSRGS